MRLRWLAELLLGAKLAIAGGRDGWVRTGLTTIGVGLGVALLLAAASLPTVLTARDARAEARYPAWPGPGSRAGARGGHAPGDLLGAGVPG